MIGFWVYGVWPWVFMGVYGFVTLQASFKKGS